MSLEGKTERKVVGEKQLKEVRVVIKPLTQEEARETYSGRPYSKYAETQFGGNEMVDDLALLLSRDAKRCKMCQAPTRSEYLIEKTCPDCDGRTEYHDKSPHKQL